jgi:8-oxo-dGTP pyrophosphatase MutT (NUDIX family)
MSNFNVFLNNLRIALSEPLPGVIAQAKLAPPHRAVDLRNTLSGDLVRDSAVLILLWQKGEQIFTVFILRPVYEGFHSNQIAFPGGKYEKSDADFVATALREAQEEVGIIPETISILGQLTPLFISPSRFMVYPVVGFTGIEPTFILDPVEIKDIIPCNLLDFLNPDHFVIQDIEVRGNILPDIPCFKTGEHLIWGATAMIFNELLEIITPIVRAKTYNDLL